MASLEGSFFTGLDVGGGGSPSNFPIPNSQVVYGTGPGVTSSADLTYVDGYGLSINAIPPEATARVGYIMTTTDTSNSPQSFVGYTNTNTGSSRLIFSAGFGYNAQRLGGDFCFFQQFESYFKTGAMVDAQTEFHVDYFSADRTVNYRAIGVDIKVEGASINHATMQWNASTISFNPAYLSGVFDIDFNGSGRVTWKVGVVTGDSSFIVQNNTSGRYGYC